MLEVDGEDGRVVYITASEAPDHLGPEITRDMVYKWHKRRKITGYRVGREVYYRLDELREVEQVIHDQRPEHGGHPRRGT